MKVVTTHIQRMLAGALELAEEANAGQSTETVRVLERATNLARHAAAELEDEMLQLRDGWAAL